MRGTLLSSSILRIMKSAGKVNLPTSTSIFSAIPIGYWNDLSTNLTFILVGLRVLRDSFTYKEYGIRLMLAPRSAKALQEKESGRNLFNFMFAAYEFFKKSSIVSIDVIDEILEEYFDALLNEGGKILCSIEETLLEEEIFFEFDEFMAMTVDENFESEFDNEEPPFEKITINGNFPGETFMEINTKDKPWFADLANYLVANIIPKGMTYQQKNKIFSDLKHYFWEEPYLFK
nr:reverse transcriptase domain-containing protein [Tanacetum cinerariifolium]